MNTINTSSTLYGRVSRLTDIPGLLEPGTRQMTDHRSMTGLLCAESATIGFVGREQELTELREWWRQRDTIGVLLYTGPSGSGKTRLLIEWCRQLSAQDELAGFVPKYRDIKDIEPLLNSAQPRVIVVDDAPLREDLVKGNLPIYKTV